MYPGSPERLEVGDVLLKVQDEGQMKLEMGIEAPSPWVSVEGAQAFILGSEGL